MPDTEPTTLIHAQYHPSTIGEIVMILASKRKNDPKCVITAPTAQLHVICAGLENADSANVATALSEYLGAGSTTADRMEDY